MKQVVKNESRLQGFKIHGALMAVLVLTAFFGAGPAEAWTYSFVSSGAGAKLWMIDVNTNQVAAEIPAEGFLEETVSADGSTSYVVNVAKNQVSVIDNAHNKVKDCIRVGKRPFGVALSLDGTKLFVLNRGSNTLSVIDTKLNKVIETDPAPMDNFGTQVSANGQLSKVK